MLYAVEKPKHQVRARYSANTITVYQAYRPEIGLAAAHDGRFPDTWDRDRMTWVKPSFLWMMYRCGRKRRELPRSQQQVRRYRLCGISDRFIR
jgi:Domain of unknown function (DUF4291)